jgi:hypothetical protein
LLVQQHSAQDGVVGVSLGHSDLLPHLVEHPQVRVSCVLDEAVQQEDHVVPLEHVLHHDVQDLVQSVLQEVHLRLLGIVVQELVSYLRQTINHQLESVLGLGRLLVVLSRRAPDHYSGVDLSHGVRVEAYQVTEVKHVPR